MRTDGRDRAAQVRSIEEVKAFIYQNADQTIDRAQLAKMMGYSIPQFHRIFTAEIGENITAYIRRVRLERAANKLLMEEANVTEIAHAAGYQSHAAFSKAFKQYHNYTPSEFRRLKFIRDAEIVQNGNSGEAKMTLIPNIIFNGNCREAMTFYAELFGGEVGVFMPWDAGTIASIPEMSEEHIMNGVIVIDGQTIMGSDQFGDMYAPAGNMSLMIELESVSDAEAKFAALAEGGQTWMPFGETFWAEGYGFCMDRFGVLWQVNCTGSKGQSE